MDYFLKFKKRVAPPKVQPTSSMQLSKFHKCWEYIHNIFIVDDRKSNMHIQQTDIPSKLRQMVDLLVDEEARQEDSSTGLCMEYFLKHGILQYLVNFAEKEDTPVGIRGEVIRTVASMIDLLDEKFLVHNSIHKPTIKLLRFCVLDDGISDLYSDDLVDLMYVICSKIHGFPALLNVFFHDKLWLTTPQKGSSDNRLNRNGNSSTNDEPHEYEFLLFTYLLRFVHREGRSGDYARTGLLFLMVMATDQLGEFILGIDFASILAAALGALYSQLPRKLIVQFESEEVYSDPVTYLLGQEVYEEKSARQLPSGLGIEYSTSPEFKYQLDSFLKLLEFYQDVLSRCPNTAICESLLQSIRHIFLGNILYPSILECSDTDGSSVAVISYIDLILQTVQQGDLSRVVVEYLMDDESQKSSNDPDGLSKGIDNLGINESKHNASSTSHFTLKDLIFSRLESRSQSTVIATLKLLKTLITKHCQYSLSLVSFFPDVNKNPTIVSHHLKEVELYFSLIIAIDKDHANEILSDGYQDYLRDLEMTIDSDWCYQNSMPKNEIEVNFNDIREESPKAKRRRSFKYGQRLEDLKKEQEEEELKQKRKEDSRCAHRPLVRHRIRSTDRLLQILLSLLSHFFTQSAELNLELTGVLSALALCPYRSLEGWVSFSERDRTNKDDILVLDPDSQSANGQKKLRNTNIYANSDVNTPINEEDEDDDRSIDFGIARGSNHKTAPTFFKSYPPFFTLLRTLTQQVEYYRSEIPGFDQLLNERRKALVSGEATFFDKRIMSPSNSSTTNVVSRNPQIAKASGNMGHVSSRRPSILRPSTLGEVPTPILSTSSSTSTAVGYNSRTNPPPASFNKNMTLNNPVSPLTLHVKKTTNTRIQPLFPSHFVSEKDEPILNLDDEDEIMFIPKISEPSKSKRADKTTEITLSMLLNNVVILEEAIKEIVALMQVRRSLGIDKVAYV